MEAGAVSGAISHTFQFATRRARAGHRLVRASFLMERSWVRSVLAGLRRCAFMGGATLGLVGPTQLSAQGLRFEGNLAGEVQLEARLPVIPWRLNLTTALFGQGPTQGEFVAETPGGTLAAQVDDAIEAGRLRWRLAPQSLDAVDLQPIAATFLADLAGVEWSGSLRVEGAGDWVDGQAQGEIRLSWQPEQMVWSAQNSELVGATWASTITVANSTVARVDLSLRWASLKVGPVKTGPGHLELSRQGEDPWEIETLETELWGGRVALAPFSFDGDKPEVRTLLSVSVIGASELVKLIPESVKSAAGTLSGEIGLTWNSVDGFRPGRGSLAMVDQPGARVQMAPAPGLLSDRVPQKIETMPQWLGPLARWAAVENPAYQELVEVETGQRALAVETLRLELYPDGKSGLRTVRADLIARPVGGTAVDRVVFGVNVMGPWEDLMMLGANQGANISVRTGGSR